MRFFLYSVSIAFVHTVSVSYAQNLISNGGFEDHGEIKCMSCYHLNGKYPSVVYHWDNMGWACFLYDKDYKLTSDEKRWNPFEKMSPYEGKAMIQMQYSPGCGAMGCISYLSAKIKEPMKVGNLYEVSIWLFIEKKREADPEWAGNIGIALLPEKLSNKYDLKVPAIRVDTVIYDTWYQAKWFVRPLCTSKYMMIGAFRNDYWPKSKSFADVQYFIDNVSVTQIAEEKAEVADSSIYYCSLYDPEKNPTLAPGVDNPIMLFETNKFGLTLEHKAVLDTFAVYVKKYPNLVFEISGHTDSIGSENLALSQNRAKAVLKYLTEVCQLPEFRFIITSLGSKNPMRSNNDEVGRAMNRRVEVRQLNISLSDVFYRNALQTMEENHYAKTFSYLNKWLLKSMQSEHIILLFDPRFEILQKDKRWALIEKKIKEGYRSFKYPDYAFLIDSLRLDDLRVTGELSWGFCEIAPDSVPFRLPRAPEAVVEQTLKEHFKAFRPVLEKIGWPKKSDFGKNTATSAFFLLQHSLDSAAYVKWLPILQKNCEEGEASWMAYAMLYDRCQIIAGKPQRYATHSEVSENGKHRVLPWEGNKDTVNGYRAKIGLPLLSEDMTEAMLKNE